ncbi:MAG TPA: hypothetical protein VGD40_00615 [Chryseosolibacter sp.]
MTKELYRWISIASVLSPLVPLICLLIYRKRQPRQNVILAVSIFISLTFDVINSALYYSRTPNHLSINLYFIIAFPAIMWFYHEILMRRSLKNITRIFTVVFFVLTAIFIFRSGLNVLNHSIFMTSSILISITSLLFIRDLNLMDASDFLNNKFHQTNILLNTSLAVYYFATVIVFSVSDYVFANASAEGFRLFWGFHNILNVSKHVGFAIAFYLSSKRNID